MSNDIKISKKELAIIEKQLWHNLYSCAKNLKQISADQLSELELKSIISNDTITAEIAHIARSLS